MPHDQADGETSIPETLEQKRLSLIERYTVGLWTVQDDVRHDRTGVLYAVADRHFILTASHVGDDGSTLADAVHAQVPLYVSKGELDSLPVPLCGPECLFHGTEASEPSARDICAIKLDQETVDHLKTKKEFLLHDGIRHNDDGHGFYVIAGFPTAWTDGCPTGVTEGPLFFFSRAFDGELQQGTNYDPRIHVAFIFSLDAFEVHSRKAETLPDIHGISGCGIWRVGDFTAPGVGNSAPYRPRLVAIEHSWSKTRGYVLGTRIGYATSRILDEYPDLRRPMSLTYPRRG